MALDFHVYELDSVLWKSFFLDFHTCFEISTLKVVFIVLDVRSAFSLVDRLCQLQSTVADSSRANPT